MVGEAIVVKAVTPGLGITGEKACPTCPVVTEVVTELGLLTPDKRVTAGEGSETGGG